MHDPKLSALVAHNQTLVSESLVDKLSSSQHYRQLSGDHLDSFHPRHSKSVALPRSGYATSSLLYPEDILDSRGLGRLLPLYHRLRDPGSSTSEMLLFPGYESAFSDVSSRYRYSDANNARQFYELLHGDRTSSLTFPTSSNVISRQTSGSDDYLLPRQRGSLSSAVILKDISSASLALQLPSLSIASSPTRVADSLSLSPLHVTTTANSSSSPLSSESSPSPLRRSSVSPDSRWSDKNIHHGLTRPGMTSSELALYENRALRGDLTFPASTLSSSFTFPPSLSSMAVYGLVPPPLMCVYTPPSIPIESRTNSSHLFDHYISPSSSSLSHHHLHHHLHRHHIIKDSFYNGSSSTSDRRSPPGKELPTKLLKQDRVRDRQELSGALIADREHTERLNNLKKSASTQTQFSSFSCENLPPPPYYTNHDTISRDKLHPGSAHGQGYSNHLPPPPPLPAPFLQYSQSIPSYHNSLSSSSLLPAPPPPPPPHSFHPNLLLSHTSPKTHPSRHALTRSSPSPPATPTLPPPPLLSQPRKCSPPAPQPLPPYSNAPQSSSPAPPPPPQYPTRTRLHPDVQHAPLNLSLSNTPAMPSIIPLNCPSTITPPIRDSDSYKGGAASDDSANHRHASDKNGSNHETAAQVSDEAIEEHFRRSLGKCYNEPSPTKKTAVLVTEKICSVDDHFARALGDQMWTEIKARSETPVSDSLPGSVDAHFAKALGAAMWKKLKAENKLTDEASSITQAESQAQSSEEQPVRQKSSPPSPLQKSLVT